MIDQEAFEILQQLPKLPFGKLVTPDPAGELSAEPPTFTYSLAQRFDVGKYRSALNEARHKIADLTMSQEVQKLYAKKLDELGLRADIVEAIQQGNDKNVTELAAQLYQYSAQNQLPAFEQEFNEHLARATRKEIHRHRDRVDARMFLLMARERLANYGIANWRVRLSRRPVVQTGHAKLSQSPILRIPKTLCVSKARAKRLLIHEIDVHVLRAHNGAQSPLLLLGRGLAGYANLEEGLAIYLQHINDKVSRQLRPGFWQSWTIALLQEHGWATTYTTLHKARLALYSATNETDAETKTKIAVENLLLRATRGITRPVAGVFFARDHVYRTGYEEIKNFVEKNGLTAIEDLFVGKIGLEHLSVVKELNVKPAILPVVLS